MTRAPIRIQRKRAKGWKMPEGAVYVGRPTQWGNPYPVNEWTDNAQAVALFEAEIAGLGEFRGATLYAAIRMALRGKDLVCWCELDQPCHADTLLRIANE